MRRPDLLIGSDERIGFEKEHKHIELDGTLTNQIFTGDVNVSNSLTHYENYTVSTNVSVVAGANPIIGGSAEMRMIGDGTHTPSFSSAFTKSAGSSDYDTTLAAVNKVIFYYDGTTIFYSITVL